MAEIALRNVPHEDEIFAAALELPAGERAAFLLRTCSGDESLRGRIEALLQGHGEAGDFLKEPIVPRAELTRRDLPAEIIGRYKLLGKIGEGGCGVVYEAEQQEPVRRRVALKVIKLGMDTNAVIARFQAERQALALMDHPNIARVYDAGATETGRPYFVMELVRGIPITAYCDRNHLAPHQRVELFIAVCAAIHHAHGKGIVHRDLKPSNILVFQNDGVPVPKVIDFGVAKATQGSLTDQTMYTAVEQFIGTPVYMSPEQANSGGLEVDLRSDIYSLGILLYELLAGRLPFDTATFGKGGVDAIRQQIQEAEPPTPSTRVRTLTEADRLTIAKARGLAPAGLSLVLRGDLDWIVMRCLEKDPARRYQTAQALALDLQHHLRHEPVAARPPSPAYLLGKLVRRRRGGFLAAGAVAAALLLGVGFNLWWLRRAPSDTASPRKGAASEAAGDVAELLRQAKGIITKLGFTQEELTIAQSETRRATELAPESAAAWGLRARTEAMFRMRSWDGSPQRIQAMQEYANRALSLDPDNSDALFALAWVLHVQASNTAPGPLNDLEAQAEKLARRAWQAAPDDSSYARTLATMIEFQDREEESRDILRQALQRNPGDPLLHYDLGTNYTSIFGPGGASPENLTAGIRELDASLAIQPFANPLIQKAVLAVGWKGDLVEMRANLDRLQRLPLAVQAEDRAVWAAMWGGLLERRPDRTFRAGGLTARDYFADGPIAQPKAFLLAEAHRLAGEDFLARREWHLAEAVLRRQLQERPDNILAQIQLALALAQQGRGAEAAALMAQSEPVIRELKEPKLDWWAARYYAARGDPAAIPFLKRSVNFSALATSHIMRLDPAFDPLRQNPAFTDYLASLPTAANPGGDHPAEPPAPAIPPVQNESAALTAQALARYAKLNFFREDLTLAASLARRATELAPDSASAWGVRAGVESAWLQRSWDLGQQRLQDTQTFANRALVLDPNDPEAQLALGRFLFAQHADAQAVQILRRGVAAHPRHVRMIAALAYVLGSTGNARQYEEARELVRTAIKLAPDNAILRYQLALSYASWGPGGDNPQALAEALRQLDAALAIQPFSSALLLKAMLLGAWRGDLPAMRAVLDQESAMPLSDQSEDRAVCIAMWAGLMEHRPDRVETAAALTARDYFEDSIMPLRPKAWLLALAHRVGGKEHLSREDWRNAESTLRQRLKDQPDNTRYQAELAITLAWLGQKSEAARIMAGIEPLWKEAPFYWSRETLALYYGAMGDAKRAAPYLAATIDRSPFWSRRIIPIDPWWDNLRGQPEFEHLLTSLQTAKPRPGDSGRGLQATPPSAAAKSYQ